MTEQDRRHDDPILGVLKSLLREISDMQATLAGLSALKPSLEEHIKKEQEFQDSLKQAVASAFLDGDPVLHRLEHEANRERAKLCRAFWQSLLFKLGEKSVWVIFAVGAAILTYWVGGRIPANISSVAVGGH